MSKNKRNGGHQAPAQQHAEGQHGRKTIEFLRKQHVQQTGAAANRSGPSQSSAKRKGS